MSRRDPPYAPWRARPTDTPLFRPVFGLALLIGTLVPWLILLAVAALLWGF